MNAPVTVYQFTPHPAESFAELDDVRLVVDAQTTDGSPVPVGSEGTVLAVWAGGAAYVAEFDAVIATVDAAHLTAAG